MARRGKNGNSKAKQQLMKELRKTRARINAKNPELLESLQIKLSSNIADVKRHERLGHADEIKLDRNKNLKTVMALYENKASSVAFQAQLKQMLLETRKETTEH